MSFFEGLQSGPVQSLMGSLCGVPPSGEVVGSAGAGGVATGGGGGAKDKRSSSLPDNVLDPPNSGNR